MWHNIFDFDERDRLYHLERMKNVNGDKRIKKTIEQLHNKDGYTREKAREALIAIGKPAVPKLIELLSNRNRLLKWEACKALGSIRDPGAAAALVTMLQDENMEVRWAAGEALIAIGAKVLAPLLSGLVKHFDSVYMRQGARHVLGAFKKKHLLNPKTLAVMDTLKIFEPGISVPIAAQKALQSIKKLNSKKPSSS